MSLTQDDIKSIARYLNIHSGYQYNGEWNFVGKITDHIQVALEQVGIEVEVKGDAK